MKQLGYLAAFSFLISPLSANHSDEKIAQDILEKTNQKDAEGLTESFTATVENLENQDPDIFQLRSFIQTFIDQTNSQYGIELTIPDVCQKMRENMDLFGIPLEERPAMFDRLALLESNAAPRYENSAASIRWSQFFKWPWEWSWFGLNKKATNPLPLQASASNSTSEKSVLLFIVLCVVGTAAICVNPAAAVEVVTALSGAVTAFYSHY